MKQTVYHMVGNVPVVFTFWGNQDLSPLELSFLSIPERLFYTLLWLFGLAEVKVNPMGAYTTKRIINIYLDNMWKETKGFVSFVKQLVETLDHEVRHHLGYRHSRDEWTRTRVEWTRVKMSFNRGKTK